MTQREKVRKIINEIKEHQKNCNCMVCFKARKSQGTCVSFVKNNFIDELSPAFSRLVAENEELKKKVDELQNAWNRMALDYGGICTENIKLRESKAVRVPSREDFIEIILGEWKKYDRLNVQMDSVKEAGKLADALLELWGKERK